jgi:hypothetical protein
MATSTQIILITLDNNAPTNNTVGPNQLYEPIFDVHIGRAILVGFDISQITAHALLVIRGTMIPSKRVENTSSGNKTLREVSKHMDVETVLAWCEALNLPVNGRGSLLLALMKNKFTLHTITIQNCATTSHLALQTKGFYARPCLNAETTMVLHG